MNFNNPIDPATVNATTLPVMVGYNSNQEIAGSYAVDRQSGGLYAGQPVPDQHTNLRRHLQRPARPGRRLGRRLLHAVDELHHRQHGHACLHAVPGDGLHAVRQRDQRGPARARGRYIQPFRQSEHDQLAQRFRAVPGRSARARACTSLLALAGRCNIVRSIAMRITVQRHTDGNP